MRNRFTLLRGPARDRIHSSCAAGRHVTTHVAQRLRYSAIDGRTVRIAGYTVSQQKRKLVEQVFGWMKTVGRLRTLHHRGGERVDWAFTFTAALYNVVRLRTLLAGAA